MKSIVKYGWLSSADNFATICPDGGQIGGGIFSWKSTHPFNSFTIERLWGPHEEKKKCYLMWSAPLSSLFSIIGRFLTSLSELGLLHFHSLCYCTRPPGPASDAAISLRPVVFVTRYKTRALHTNSCTLARRDIRQPRGGHFYHRCRAGCSPATDGGLWGWSWAVQNTGQTRVSH